VRACVARFADDDHLPIIVLHPIAADGRSLEVLFEELAAWSTAIRERRPLPLPALPIQYADYAAFEQSWLRSPEMERRLAWWKQELDGAPPLLTLPTDRSRPSVQTFAGGMEKVAIPSAVTAQLRTIGRGIGASLYMTFVAAFATLLSRYSGQTEVCIGCPVENRPFPETSRLIGVFVNTIVLRISLAGDPSF